MRNKHKDPVEVAKLFLDWALAGDVVELYERLAVLGEPFDDTGPANAGVPLLHAAEDREDLLRFEAERAFLRLVGTQITVPNVGTYAYRYWRRHGDVVVFNYARPCGLREVDVYLNFRTAAVTNMGPPRLDIEPEADTRKYDGRGYLSVTERMALVDAFLGED